MEIVTPVFTGTGIEVISSPDGVCIGKARGRVVSLRALRGFLVLSVRRYEDKEQDDSRSAEEQYWRV